MNLLPAAAAGIEAPPGAVAGIRPHDVVLDAAGPLAAAGQLAATVTLIEPRGADFVVHLQPQTPDTPVLVAVVARHAPPPAGSSVRLTLPAGQLHLFDGTSGRRLDSQSTG